MAGSGESGGVEDEERMRKMRMKKLDIGWLRAPFYPAIAAFLAVLLFTACAPRPEVKQARPEPVPQDTSSAEPEMLSVAQVLYQHSGSGPCLQLEMVSDDPTYGYSYENPIKIGGGFPDGDLRVFRYLNALLDPNRQPIAFSRVGTCCPFSASPGKMGSGRGVLDVFQIDYDGLSEPIRLYFDVYHEKRLLAPIGLNFRTD